jgi:hypothetical protein
LDEAGNAYITGSTISTESSFPVLVGPDLTYNGNIQYGFGDAFVAKVNAAGTSLVYAGYIGGSKSDGGFDIAVDANGNAYIAGSTNSDETTFPLVVGPFLTFQPGVYSIPQHDAFVAKVNANGSSLLYAGYIGGEESDLGNGIALDEDGSVYVTGSTLSKYSFPTLVGPSLSIHGDVDAYVAKVNPAGTGLVYAGYIGGSADDVGSDIAVDGEGNAYITGGTFSTESTLLVVGGPDLTHNGNQDAFVVKVNPDGSGLVYAGYLGGASEDWGKNIAVDNAANAYIVGYTDSDQSTFPELDGPDLTYNGGRDAFVAMVNPPGSGLVYAGYVGGTGSEEGRGIAVDSSGNAYFSGKTDSNELSFPEKGGPDLTFNGGTDVFVSKIGSANAGSTDLAVSRTEIIQGITMSDNYSVHIAGKPALLRAFVTLQGKASQDGVTARLTRYVGDVAMDSLDACLFCFGYHFVGALRWGIQSM